MPKKQKPFADMSSAELHEAASDAEIEGRSAMNKDELIAALEAKAAGGAPTVGAAGDAAESPLTLSAPAEVQCHDDFDVAWSAPEDATVIIAGLGVVTTSPVRLRASQQGAMTVTASTVIDGKQVTASATVNVVPRKV